MDTEVTVVKSASESEAAPEAPPESRETATAPLDVNDLVREHREQGERFGRFEARLEELFQHQSEVEQWRTTADERLTELNSQLSQGLAAVQGSLSSLTGSLQALASESATSSADGEGAEETLTVERHESDADDRPRRRLFLSRGR